MELSVMHVSKISSPSLIWAEQKEHKTSADNPGKRSRHIFQGWTWRNTYISSHNYHSLFLSLDVKANKQLSCHRKVCGLSESHNQEIQTVNNVQASSAKTWCTWYITRSPVQKLLSAKSHETITAWTGYVCERGEKKENRWSSIAAGCFPSRAPNLRRCEQRHNNQPVLKKRQLY